MKVPHMLWLGVSSVPAAWLVWDRVIGLRWCYATSKNETDELVLAYGKLMMRYFPPEKAQYVRIRSPEDPHQRVWRMVFATAGDIVPLEDGPIRVPEHSVFVIGGTNEADSTTWGPIPVSLIDSVYVERVYKKPGSHEVEKPVGHDGERNA